MAHQQLQMIDFGTNSTEPSIKERIRDINERLVNRWHFLMLNDVARNSLFNKAISEAVRKLDKPVVLDIGSGTGILSLMAARGGAKHVYACDMSHVMAGLSHDIVAANQMQDRITVLHTLSNDISVPRDIPSKVSLVVMEIFDAGLLGEYAIPSLKHAWKELMLLSHRNDDPASLVVPCGSTVFVCAVECKEVRKQTRLLNSVLSSVFEAKNVSVIGSCKLSDVAPPIRLTDEPYTTEDLSNVKGGVGYLTAPVKSFTFNFSIPQVPVLPDSRLSLQLPVIKCGRVDAIALWFELHLNESRTLSTAPDSSTRWEQAIYPVKDSPTVENGGQIIVDISCDDTRFYVNKVCTMDQHQESSSVNDCSPLYIERSHLYRLNDTVFMEALIAAIKECLDQIAEEEDLRIIDISDGISLLGLLTGIVIGSKNSFILVNCSKLYTSFLQNLSITENVMFIEEVPPSLITTTWDMILISDIITPQGTLSSTIFTQLSRIDVSDAILIPYSVDVVLMGVASSDLRAMSCVLGTVPTVGINVAEHINKYQITHLTDVDMSVVPYSQVTEECVAHEIDLSNLQQSNVSKTLTLKATDGDCILTGIMYWFILHLHGDRQLSTSPTHSSETHWHQSVFLAPEDINVQNGQDVKVVFRLINGYIDIIFN